MFLVFTLPTNKIIKQFLIDLFYYFVTILSDLGFLILAPENGLMPQRGKGLWMEVIIGYWGDWQSLHMADPLFMPIQSIIKDLT
jgi:hypothetical protein